MDWLTRVGTYFEFGPRDRMDLCYDAEAHQEDPDGLPLRDYIDQFLRHPEGSKKMNDYTAALAPQGLRSEVAEKVRVECAALLLREADFLNPPGGRINLLDRAIAKKLRGLAREISVLEYQG